MSSSWLLFFLFPSYLLFFNMRQNQAKLEAQTGFEFLSLLPQPPIVEIIGRHHGAWLVLGNCSASGFCLSS